MTTTKLTPSQAKALEAKAVKQIMGYDVAFLCELWSHTVEITDEGCPTVRGWIMDALEAKDPDGFDKWMANEKPELEEKPEHFFL